MEIESASESEEFGVASVSGMLADLCKAEP